MRAKLVQTVLDEYFPSPSIPLTHSDVFTLLVAVVLSAQCTDKKVNEITPKLFQRASTPEEFMHLLPDEVQSIIRPCGLSGSKSKNLIELSRMICELHQGQVPRTFKDLEALPGVGHKTASVVMTQAYNEPAFPVDTHIHRCAKRWGLSSGKDVKTTERDLKRLFSKGVWGKIHLQIIYFARKYCSAKKHDIDQCPICSKIASGSV